MKTTKTNVLKKVASVAVSAALVGTTLVGAAASDLRDLPAPFVADGVADVQFVIGANAAAQDTIGAVDIATAFQSAAVTETTVNVPGTTTDYSVTDGVEISQSGDDLNFGEVFSLGSALEFDRNDFPELLADGTIKDQDENEEWDYDQEVQFPSSSYPIVNFGIPDSDVFGDLPQLYVDFGTSDDAAYRIFVDFDESSKLGADTASDTEGLQDSETVEIFGKIFTFDPDNHAAESDFTLFGSDVVTFLELNVPQTITVDGQAVEVEVIGGNSDNTNNEIILSVNGQRESVNEGQSRTIGGIEVFVQDVFIRNIPTLDASATIFIGSDEFKLTQSTAFDRVELNGNDIEGMYFALNNDSGNSADINGTDDFSFEFRPGDLDDEYRYLLVGESIMDPMFDVELNFAGPRPALNEEERAYVALERSGDEFSLQFTNRDGDFYDIPIFEETDNDQIRYVQDASGTVDFLVIDPTELSEISGRSTDDLEEDDFFITYEGSTSNAITKVYAVDRFEQDNSINYVELKDLSTGQTYKLKDSDTLASTQLTVDTVDYANREFNFTSNSRIVNWIVTEGEMAISFGPVYNSTGSQTATETAAGTWDLANSATVSSALQWHNLTASGSETISMFYDEDWEGDFLDESSDVTAGNITLLIVGDSDDEDIEIQTSTFAGSTAWPSASTSVNGDGEFDDFEYSMSQYGTYAVEETEDSGRFFRVWYPSDGEADYVVFMSPQGSQVISTAGSAGGVTTQTVNKFSVGAAVLDEDIDLATAPSNLVVVGGPVVNSVAFELLGQPTEADINEMFAPGTAMVKLFDLDNGNVAMLVAGWSARDTQAATRKVALLDGTLSGEEARLTVSSLNSVTVQNVQ